GEARLRAEAAVLGAAAGLGVDQRAHVGGVSEALDASAPGTLDQLFDRGVVLKLAEREGLLASDQRPHPRKMWQARRTAGEAASGPASAAGGARRRRACPRACPARRRRRGATRSARVRPRRGARPRSAAA